MVIDPITLSLIASGIGLGLQGISSSKDRKFQKKRNKETKKQTEADLKNASLNKSYELEEQGARSNQRLAQRKAKALRDTAATVRGSLQ